MPKTRTTLTSLADVLRAVKLRAACSGRGDSEVIEEALRVQLGLGFLDSMWAKASLSEAEAGSRRGGAARDPPAPPLLRRACGPRPERHRRRAHLVRRSTRKGPGVMGGGLASRRSPRRCCSTSCGVCSAIRNCAGTSRLRRPTPPSSGSARAREVTDPTGEQHLRSDDPVDDYLIALAAVISGDRHLLELSDRIPVYSPREFLELLGG